MQNDWFTIFKFKATARAHMSKIWQFQLYFLNCWSFCYQTLFDSALSWAKVSYKEIELLYSRSRLQQNFKMSLNVNCLSRWYLLNAFTTKLSMVMHHHESDCCQKHWFAVLRVKVTVKYHIIKISLSNISSELLILLHLSLVLMTHHHKLDCLVKRLDYSVVFKVKETEMVKNSSECSSRW